MTFALSIDNNLLCDETDKGGYAVPEPSSLLLLGSGLTGFAVLGSKRFKNAVIN